MVVNIRTEMKAKAQDLDDLSTAATTCSVASSAARTRPGDTTPGPGGNRIRRRAQTAQPSAGARASGTGFIISKDGFILTNNHVVEDATKIEVSLYGDDERLVADAKADRPRSAHRQRADPSCVEKPSDPLPEVKFGDSSQMAPGDWVMAIGNPFGLHVHGQRSA